MDSELVIKQLLGKYKVKQPHLKILFDKVKINERLFSKVNYRSFACSSPFALGNIPYILLCHISAVALRQDNEANGEVFLALGVYTKPILCLLVYGLSSFLWYIDG